MGSNCEAPGLGWPVKNVQSVFKVHLIFIIVKLVDDIECKSLECFSML